MIDVTIDVDHILNEVVRVSTERDCPLHTAIRIVFDDLDRRIDRLTTSVKVETEKRFAQRVNNASIADARRIMGAVGKRHLQELSAPRQPQDPPDA